MANATPSPPSSSASDYEYEDPITGPMTLREFLDKIVLHVSTSPVVTLCARSSLCFFIRGKEPPVVDLELQVSAAVEQREADERAMIEYVNERRAEEGRRLLRPKRADRIGQNGFAFNAVYENGRSSIVMWQPADH